MTARGKELYKTFKRSISSSVNEVLSTSSSSSSAAVGSSGTKYSGRSGTTWIHPPDVILNGRVEYAVKFLGSKDVDNPRGSDTVRDALHAIRFQLQVKRSETGHAGAKLQKVEIQISVEGVVILDTKTKMILHNFPLQRISFCADDKQDKRVFAFIVKADGDSGRHDCFIFLSDTMAEQIVLTVGEAFDLGYKKYMEKNKISLENQRQVFVLRKRIVELETENQILTARLADWMRENTRAITHPQMSLMDIPALPSTPMPIGPPPGVAAVHNDNDVYNNSSMNAACAVSTDDPFANLINAPSSFASAVVPLSNVYVNSQNGCTPSSSSSGISPSGPAPSQPPPPIPTVTPTIAPPPPVAPRRNLPPRNNAPEVGRRLENLQMDKLDDVFDDSFDPRATKKTKDAADYDPFGDDFLDDVISTGDAAGRATVSKASAGQPTADDYQDMIDKLEKRLADMKFDKGTLDTGEVSPDESFRDLEESEYGTPLDKVNTDIASVPKPSSK